MKIYGIYRERIFSPGKVIEDAAILDTVLCTLSHAGHETHAISAESITDDFKGVGLILSMAQSERSLSILEKADRSGIPVVNPVSAVRSCYRKALIEILSQTSIPMPASRIESVNTIQDSESFDIHGDYWLKRGDVHALGPGDVAKIGSLKELTEALMHFRRQGVDQVLVQKHVDGPCAKFYGVGAGPECWFSVFLSASGEDISFNTEDLSETARAAAGSVGLEIYGGDAILATDGTWVLIDLNDWPTFSPCRGSAARAIIEHLERGREIKGVANGIS
jgi:glutathione synthase/RimK-type ligase-like ATP-grasp enzyme